MKIFHLCKSFLINALEEYGQFHEALASDNLLGAKGPLNLLETTT